VQLPYRIEFEWPTRRQLRQALGRRGIQVVMVAGVLGAALATAAIHADFQHAQAMRGFLAIHSVPTGAAVSIDGHGVGRTPLTIAASPSLHQVVVGGGPLAADHFTARVNTRATTSLSATLWRATPTVLEIHSPLPGARIDRTGFLDNGSLWLSVALPPGDAHQLWRFDDHGVPTPVGSTALPGLGALSPNGHSVASAAAVTTDGAPNSPILVVASVADGRSSRRYSLAAAAGPIADIAWAPDNRHLLVVTARNVGGDARSALSWLDTEDGTLRSLAELPSTVVVGSEVWRPDGRAVAFIAHAANRSALCLLDVATGSVRSLADLRAGTPPAFAPLAWSPNGRAAVYAAAVPATASGLGGLVAGQSTLTTLFLLPGDEALGQPLIPGPGDSPVWRKDGTILAVAAGSRQGAGLQAIDPTDRRTWAAGSITVPGSGPLAFVWDVAHAQALATRGDTFGARSYWLLSFSPEVQP